MSKKEPKKQFSEQELDRIIEMAWEDRTPFEAMAFQFSISERKVIDIMRVQLKPQSFKRWRKRVQGCSTKHAFLRTDGVTRFKCTRQRQITGNKISKR